MQGDSIRINWSLHIPSRLSLDEHSLLLDPPFHHLVIVAERATVAVGIETTCSLLVMTCIPGKQVVAEEMLVARGLPHPPHGRADGAQGGQLQDQAGKTSLVLRLLGPGVVLQHLPEVQLCLLHLLLLLQTLRPQVKPSSVKDRHGLQIGELYHVHLEGVDEEDQLVYDPIKDGSVKSNILRVGPLHNNVSSQDQSRWLPVAILICAGKSLGFSS